jgi:hypothetical protein
MGAMEGAVKIFIGTADVCRLEEKMMIDSLLRHATIPVEIVLLNGDTGWVEGGGIRERVDVPATLRSRFVTRFTAMRFQIPKLCGYRGLAIYMDSDQLLRADIAELTKALPSSAAFAAVRADEARCGSASFRADVLAKIAPQNQLADYYLASVMVMDASRCRFDLDALAAAVDAGLPYWDLIWLGPKFRQAFNLRAAALDSRWNQLDQVNDDAKLVHFTAINTQPWVYSHYTPTGRFWLDSFADALQRGVITEADLRKQRRLGKLSWSNLHRGLAILGASDAPAPLLDAYDIGRWAILNGYWKAKRLLLTNSRDKLASLRTRRGSAHKPEVTSP